jgi:hypothetical protein
MTNEELTRAAFRTAVHAAGGVENVVATLRILRPDIDSWMAGEAKPSHSVLTDVVNLAAYVAQQRDVG